MSLICSIQNSTRLSQFSTCPAQNALALGSGWALVSLTVLTSQVSYGVSIVDIMNEIDYIVKAPYCILSNSSHLLGNSCNMSFFLQNWHNFMIDHTSSSIKCHTMTAIIYSIWQNRDILMSNLCKFFVISLVYVNSRVIVMLLANAESFCI